MRYRKGHIAVSEERDIPVLLHIRNARAIAQDQLWRLLCFENREDSERSARWRIARLERAELIERVDVGRYFKQPVYSITQVGMSLLEYQGHSLVSMSSESGSVLHKSQVFHALELVNIRLALAESGVLRTWTCELEVASRNLVYSLGVTKDFDALAEIDVDGVTHRIGLEYERTVKASARYTEIRETLDRDRTVNAVLYLASSRDVLHVLALELTGIKKRIGFVMCDEFRRDLFEASTLLNTSASSLVRFGEFLSLV